MFVFLNKILQRSKHFLLGGGERLLHAGDAIGNASDTAAFSDVHQERKLRLCYSAPLARGFQLNCDEPGIGHDPDAVADSRALLGGSPLPATHGSTGVHPSQVSTLEAKEVVNRPTNGGFR